MLASCRDGSLLAATWLMPPADSRLPTHHALLGLVRLTVAQLRLPLEALHVDAGAGRKGAA